MASQVFLELECVYKCKITGREPVLPLQCLHFICSANNCNAKFEANGRVCPLCRYEVQPLESKIIPDQLFLKEPEKLLADINLRCDVCVRNLPAVAYCQNCDGCICEECKNNHLFNKELRQKNHRVTPDLSEAKKRELEKLKVADLKCKIHDLNFTEYCEPCGLKICPNGLPFHEGHALRNIATSKAALRASMDTSINLAEKLTDAVLAITTKQVEMRATEKSRVLAGIDQEFDELIKKLHNDKQKRKAEAIELFSHENEVLTAKRQKAERLKPVTERFNSIAEAILNDGSDVSAVKFVSAYEELTDKLSSMHNQLTNRMGEYTEKDISILSDISTTPEILKLLNDFGKVTCRNQAKPTPNVSLEDAPHQENGGDDDGHADLDAGGGVPEMEQEVVPTETLRADANGPGNQMEMGTPLRLNINTTAEGTGEDSTKPVRKKPGRKSNRSGLQEGEPSQKRLKSVPQRNVKQRVPRKKSGCQSGTKGNPSHDESSDEEGCNPGPSSRIRSSRGRQSVRRNSFHDNLLGPSKNSMEERPSCGKFPIQEEVDLRKDNRKATARKNDKMNDDYCWMCLDGGDEDGKMVCCDFKGCVKTFHQRCHVPAITVVNEKDQWRCIQHTEKASLDQQIAALPAGDDSENSELTEFNQAHFMYACKFMMECYSIYEIPTVRWKFTEKYWKANGKVPVHLKYIRERLALREPAPFAGVKDMLLAYKQMFIDAFCIYENSRPKSHLKAAKECFRKFRELIDKYYPQHQDIFKDILKEQ